MILKNVGKNVVNLDCLAEIDNAKIYIKVKNELSNKESNSFPLIKESNNQELIDKNCFQEMKKADIF